MNDRIRSNRFEDWFRRITILWITIAVGWWLLSDTYARYIPSYSDHHSIRFAHFGNYQDYALWREVILDFEKTHPQVHVQQEYVVGLAGHYNTKMRQQILSKTCPDVALIQLGPFHEWADHFADLTDLVQSTTIDHTPLIETLNTTGLNAFLIKGSQRGLPVSGGNLLIYCNLNCFRRASTHLGQDIPLPGNDWTMDDFYRTAQRLTCDFDGDGQIDQFGFWLPRWIYFLPFIWSHGANIIDDAQQTWTFNSTEAKQAMTLYKRMTTHDRVSPRDDEVPQLFQDVGFLTGKTAMCVNGPWFLPFLENTRLADQYLIAPIPVGPAGRTTRITWDAIVMSGELNPDQRKSAWSFMQYLLSKPVQDRIAKSGRALPARTDSVPMFVNDQDHPRRERFIEALSYSRLQPILPRFNTIDRAINEHLYRLIQADQNLSVERMLKQLAQDQRITDVFEVVTE